MSERKSIVKQSDVHISDDGFVTLPLKEFIPLVSNAVAYVMKFKIPEINFVDNPLFTEDKTIGYLNCSTAHLYQLTAEKKVVSVPFGRKFLYLKSSLDRYLSETQEVANEL